MRELFVLPAHLCKTLMKLCRPGGLYAVAAGSLAPKFDYKLAWFERLLQHAKRLFASNQPVVLAGDFNVVPTDFDIYNPKSWKKDALLQPESRDAYRRLLAQGWIDAIRARHPEEAVYTFWDYFRNHWQRNAGLRIDHLLLSPTLAPRLVDAKVDTWVRGEPGASDHVPVWVEIALPLKRSVNRRSAKPTLLDGRQGKRFAELARVRRSCAANDHAVLERSR